MSPVADRSQTVQRRRKLARQVSVRTASYDCLLELESQVAGGLLGQPPKWAMERPAFQRELRHPVFNLKGRSR